MDGSRTADSVMQGTSGLRALVWKRADFRESSRLITLLSEDLGKLTVLGKGAHRAGSQCLGRIDFLNLIRVKISGANLPVLHRVELLHEHRGLREPARYLAASYLTELFDPALPQGRVDRGLFELLTGGLLLLERCPRAVIPQILAGVELRFLRELGLQPPLLRCSRCEASIHDGALIAAPDHPGLLCRRHAAAGTPPVSQRVLRWLDVLGKSRGRDWPALPSAPPGVLDLLGRWTAAAIERRPRMRRYALGASQRN